MSTTLFFKSTTNAYTLANSVNELLYSTTFDNAVWVPLNGTVTDSGTTDPNSGTLADTFTATAANSTLYQTVVVEASRKTFSIYLKRKTGTGVVSITPDGVTFEDVTSQINGATWTRVDLSAEVASGAILAGIKLATSGDAVYIFGAQLEMGAVSAYDATDGDRLTFTQVTDADYPKNTVRGVAYLDGRWFVMTPDAEIYQSALEDGTSWAALEFIGSNSNPSAGVFLTRKDSYIVAFKEYSTAFYYDAANASGSILAPVSNAEVLVGCASAESVQQIAGTILWIGQTREGNGRAVYGMNGTTPEKVSTVSIAKILDADSLSDVRSWSAKSGSHILYGLTLVNTGVSICYDLSTQQWSYLTYLTSDGSGTVTAVSAAGVVTSAAHGRLDGDIVLLSSCGEFDGWHVIGDVTTDTYTIGTTGTAFSGSGTAAYYSESIFPIVASIACAGRQVLQDATSGVLYEMESTSTYDEVGSTCYRVRTDRFDGGSVSPKFIAEAEIVGDKTDGSVALRWSDDDYQTVSDVRHIDLSLNRSRTRRLGKGNRRSFEVIHVGTDLVRLEALEIQLEQGRV